ncbi:hypothetical protein LCGC14_1516890 [marine sediment metagenome]|uniref:Uncharacterized protein n=1 Tax=marine sediment metagenome TaxID=412755 RepID=A0A0F9JKK3_9ZZZZ
MSNMVSPIRGEKFHHFPQFHPWPALKKYYLINLSIWHDISYIYGEIMLIVYPATPYRKNFPKILETPWPPAIVDHQSYLI